MEFAESMRYRPQSFGEVSDDTKQLGFYTIKNMGFLTLEKTAIGVHFNIDFIFLDVT